MGQQKGHGINQCARVDWCAVVFVPCLGFPASKQRHTLGIRVWVDEEVAPKGTVTGGHIMW